MRLTLILSKLRSTMENSRLYSLVGSRISQRRLEMKITQADLAEAVGVSRPSLANMERGRQVIALHHLYRLVSALELAAIGELVPLNSQESRITGRETLEDEMEMHSEDDLSDDLLIEVRRARSQMIST